MLNTGSSRPISLALNTGSLCAIGSADTRRLSRYCQRQYALWLRLCARFTPRIRLRYRPISLALNTGSIATPRDPTPTRNEIPMPNAFQRRFPLLALQFIHFRELRTSWLILLLLVFLVTIATTYPEVSRDSAFWIRHIWIIALLLHAAILAISIANARRTTLIMNSMQRIRPWIRSQIAATLLIEFPFVGLVWAFFGFGNGNAFVPFFNGLAMALFLAATTISVCGSLQTTLLSLDASKSNRLRLVTSAPWLLVAWILGLSAGLNANYHHAPLVELSALAALALSNATIHAFLSRIPNE